MLMRFMDTSRIRRVNVPLSPNEESEKENLLVKSFARVSSNSYVYL